MYVGHYGAKERGPPPLPLDVIKATVYHYLATQGSRLTSRKPLEGRAISNLGPQTPLDADTKLAICRCLAARDSRRLLQKLPEGN